MYLYMQSSPADDPLMPFPALIRKHGWPKRTAYGWKDAGLFPVVQINHTILVRESEVLAALELFRRVGRSAPGTPVQSAPPATKTRR